MYTYRQYPVHCKLAVHRIYTSRWWNRRYPVTNARRSSQTRWLLNITRNFCLQHYFSVEFISNYNRIITQISYFLFDNYEAHYPDWTRIQFLCNLPGSSFFIVIYPAPLFIEIYPAPVFIEIYPAPVFYCILPGSIFWGLIRNHFSWDSLLLGTW